MNAPTLVRDSNKKDLYLNLLYITAKNEKNN